MVWRDAVKKLNVALNTSEVLSTPSVEPWIEAGYAKPTLSDANTGSKRVGWTDSDENTGARETELYSDMDEPTIFATCKSTNQVVEVQSRSPHPEAASTSPPRRPHIPPITLQISPLRSTPLQISAEGTNGMENGCAQELLRAVVKDVMYGYRQETREDIKGLHLDLLRMGRSWKVCEYVR